MEEQGRTRPRMTFFPPPQSRQSERPCPANWDLDLDALTSSSRATDRDQLLVEEKVKACEEAKKKTAHLHKRLRKQFLKDQERKMAWRKKTAEQFKKSLEVFDRRSGKVSASPARAAPAAEAKPSKAAGAAGKKGTERRV